MGALEKVLPEYQVAITSARGGDEEMRFIRNAKRAEVIALLSELAAYVTAICNGDPAMLVSSGFKLKKARGTTILPPVKDLKVNIDRAGEAVTKVKRVAGAKAYIHQYTTDPLTGDNVWINQVTTALSYTFTGLKSKEKYWFQVIAIGLNDQKSASPCCQDHSGIDKYPIYFLIDSVPPGRDPCFLYNIFNTCHGVFFIRIFAGGFIIFASLHTNIVMAIEGPTCCMLSHIRAQMGSITKSTPLGRHD